MQPIQSAHNATAAAGREQVRVYLMRLESVVVGFLICVSWLVASN